MQSVGLGVDIFHKSLAFSASGERLAGAGERRESDFKKLVHAFDCLDEVVELSLEDVDGVLQNRGEVYFASGDEIQLLLHGSTHCGQTQLGIDLLVSVNEDDPEWIRNEFPSGGDDDVIPLTDVVDVHGDGGVGSNPVLLHKSD